jgi:hypothetical protein
VRTSKKLALISFEYPDILLNGCMSARMNNTGLWTSATRYSFVGIFNYPANQTA